MSHRAGEHLWAALAFAITVAATLTPIGPAAKAAAAVTAPVRGPNTLDYYPAEAKREGISGRVGLECSVDAKGRARDIVVTESGGPILDDAAKKLLADMRFRLPHGWSGAR
jgi:TonB family protein